MIVKPEWVEKTRYHLAAVASRGEVITYGDLYDHMRAIHFPSWPTRSPGHSWMNNYLAPTLSELGRMNRTYEEPLLTSLVRNGDTGYVGHGYVTSVLNRYGVSIEDGFIAHSEVETGKCHRFFGEPK
jgi:hypothetical protein